MHTQIHTKVCECKRVGMHTATLHMDTYPHGGTLFGNSNMKHKELANFILSKFKNLKTW